MTRATETAQLIASAMPSVPTTSCHLCREGAPVQVTYIISITIGLPEARILLVDYDGWLSHALSHDMSHDRNMYSYSACIVCLHRSIVQPEPPHASWRPKPHTFFVEGETIVCIIDDLMGKRFLSNVNALFVGHAWGGRRREDRGGVPRVLPQVSALLTSH